MNFIYYVKMFMCLKKKSCAASFTGTWCPGGVNFTQTVPVCLAVLYFVFK